MRNKLNLKLILYSVLSIIVIIVIKTQKYSGYFLTNDSYVSSREANMKYILLWTQQKNIPFVYMGLGQDGFISRHCPYTNCIVSGNRSLLGSTTAFDAIIFAGPELTAIDDAMLPAKRLPFQKFVFASIESPDNYPLCFYNFNGYFNWTWTYKLDSDIRWGYITIKDTNNNVVGPKKNMNWISWFDMKPVSEIFKENLKTKTKAVAWFVSNCLSHSRREGYVLNLKMELNKYNLKVDVYGDCGTHSCPRDKEYKCNEILRTDYYFYLSFENAFSEDYVTEKLLHPLQNNVVPIVYGGANYSRFLPNRSYLNARELGIYELAKEIDYLIKNPEKYADLFRWTNHYKYYKTTDSIDTNEYCNMCAALNNEEYMKTQSVYTEFNDFWELHNTC